MKKILCPVNFTETALNALEYAANLANYHQGILTMMHVVTEDEYNELLEEDEDIRTRFREEDEKLQRKLASLSGEVENSYPKLKCDFAIGYGDLTDVVNDFCKKGNYQLIVMGNDGVVDATEAFRGSTVVKIIQEAPCAVLSVPRQATFNGFRNVVFGTDFQKSDREALHQLYLLLKPSGSSINVVHLAKQENDGEKAGTQKKMNDLKSYLNYPRTHYIIKKYSGSVHLGLNEYLQEENGDMLVLLTHQRNLLERLFQQSISKRISYFADYPVLIYLEENL